MISSFDKLKVAIATTALILAIMDPRRPFVVETNASAIAIGAILIQDGPSISFEIKSLIELNKTSLLMSMIFFLLSML